MRSPSPGELQARSPLSPPSPEPPGAPVPSLSSPGASSRPLTVRLTMERQTVMLMAQPPRKSPARPRREAPQGPPPPSPTG